MSHLYVLLHNDREVLQSSHKTGRFEQGVLSRGVTADFNENLTYNLQFDVAIIVL